MAQITYPQSRLARQQPAFQFDHRVTQGRECRNTTRGHVRILRRIAQPAPVTRQRVNPAPRREQHDGTPQRKCRGRKDKRIMCPFIPAVEQQDGKIAAPRHPVMSRIFR